MAIVNMIGFDQLAAINSVTPTRLALEGFPELAGGVRNISQAHVVKFQGRTWLRFAPTYSSYSSSIIAKGGYFTKSLPLRDYFGDHDKLTRGVIGFRFHTSATIPESIAGYYNGLLDINQSPTRLGSSALNNLPAGEHFIEFVFDFKAKVIEMWLNGELKDSLPATLNLDAQASIGILFYRPINENYGIYFSFCDLYMIWDTEDDSPCDRLGPVRIEYLPIEEVTLPSDWSFRPREVINYTVDGVSRPFVPLIPRDLNANQRAGEVELYSVPAYQPVYVLPRGDSRINVENCTTTTEIVFGVKFPTPRRVTAYALGAFNNTAYGLIVGWRLEARNDEGEWVIVDERPDESAGYSRAIVYTYRIDASKIGMYDEYRLVSTKNVVGTSGSVYAVSMSHFQLLCDEATFGLGEQPDEYVNRPYLDNNGDVVRPTLLTSTSESEAAFRFAQPTVGSADIKMVQLRLSGLRDPGTEERLIVRSELGDIATDDQDVRMDTDIRQGVILENHPLSHAGDVWTADQVGQLKLIVKSKTGAN